MTNKFKHIALMLFVAGAMVMTTSCSKDDSSSNASSINSSSNASSIKGWYFTQTEYISDWLPGITAASKEYIHIVSDNYLEWNITADHMSDYYSTPLEGHSGWYTDGSPIGKTFVRDGNMIVCENGWMISIDGNKLHYDGDTYYKE